MKSGAVCCILLKLCTRHSFSVLVVSMLSFSPLSLSLSLHLFELHCISSTLESYKKCHCVCGVHYYQLYCLMNG